MQELQSFLSDTLLGAEFFSALVGAIYFIRLRNSYWKWFSLYLIIIFIQEYFWTGNNSVYYISRIEYYVFLGIPIQFLFFYWLYAHKSLKNVKLFSICSLAYTITIGMTYYLAGPEKAYSLSINMGSIILTVLVVLEFIKQIKNDDILKFIENKMFYINTGMVLFYLGTYPFVIFGKEMYVKYPKIYDIYYTYFLIANCIMYLLFAASFIWGKKEEL